MDMSGSQPPPPGQMTPAPKKSGWVKWVLIGCGGVTVLVGACCVGMSLLAYWGVQKAFQEMARQFEPVLASNEVIQKELGEDVKLTPSFKFEEEIQNGKKVVKWTWDAEGKKGKGKILFYVDQQAGGKSQTWDLTLEDASGKRKHIGKWSVEEGKGFQKIEIDKSEE